MLILLLLALQPAAPADIELRATVRARSLTIEKAGQAKVTVTADGQHVVDIQGPRANGRKRISNPVFNVDIKARIADPNAAPQPPTPPSD